MSFEKALAAEITRLRKRLAELSHDATEATKRTIRGPLIGTKRIRSTRAKAKPRPRLSPKVRAQRVLQGRYMGHVRRLTEEQKKKVSEIRQKSGYRKAIAEAKRMVNR
jgi:hypothetical protein